MPNIASKVFACVLVVFAAALAYSIITPNKIAYWDKQRKGANIFNHEIIQENIEQAKTYGIEYLRISPHKMLSASKDFLLGDADDYKSLIPEDVEKLKRVLDWCHENNIKVVLVMASLPGSRWLMDNYPGDHDLRIWQDAKYQEQAAQMWQDIAKEFRHHPAIVGFDIMNNPYLERMWNKESAVLCDIEQESAQEMLNKFYEKVVAKIREVDSETPILLESSGYSDPRCFKKLKPLADKNILYTFHIYAPMEYTNMGINKGKFTYPGNIEDIDSKKTKYWDKYALEQLVSDVVIFQKRFNIPSNRIITSEFGANRAVKGLEYYFEDIIDLVNEQNWHWSVYAFREDTWDGMDYEFAGFIDYSDENAKRCPNFNPKNPVFQLLRNEWRNK